MADDRPRYRLRWKLGSILLLIPIVATAVAWFSFRGDLTTQVMWLYFIWPAALFVMLLWWAFLSGLPARTRIVGLAMLAAAMGVWLALFRHKFDGAMRPRPAFRWEHPVWPAVTLLIMYAWTFLPWFTWKTRLIGLASLAGVAVLAGTVFQFDGFDLHPAQPGEDYWSSLEEIERTEQSYALQRRFEREATRFGSNGNNSKPEKAADLSRYSPSGFLRSREVKDWRQWKRVDGVALAVGAGPRVLFQPEERYPTEDDWPQFRGPNRDSVVRESGIRLDWTDENRPKNLWAGNEKIGEGWSSFAVVDGFAITQEQRGEKECVVCYDFGSRSQVWVHEVDAHFQSVNGGDGPRATPTVAGRRVYSLGSEGDLCCLDVLTGKPYWQTNILTDAGAKNRQWGMAGSPLVAGNLVFVNPGKGGNKAVVAYDRFTGEIVWATGNEPAGFSSPVMHRIHGVPQLLIFNGIGLFSYDPNTGRELWKYDQWRTDNEINVAMPIVQRDRIFISSAYRTGSALLKVSVEDGKWSVEPEWIKRSRFQLKFNDGIYKDGHIYALDETILSCVEFATGRLKWRIRGDFGYGQLLLVGQTLVITGESGRVSFIKAEPTRPSKNYPSFQALNRGRRALEEKGIGWNHAVINRGRLLIRNDREVACYDLTGSVAR